VANTLAYYDTVQITFVRGLVQAPGVVFTTLYFLRKLRMGPISLSAQYTRVERLAKDKQSCLPDPFGGYEENEVL